MSVYVDSVGQAYVRHHHLEKHLRTHRQVLRVEPLMVHNRRKWDVVSVAVNPETGLPDTVAHVAEQFDAVLLCTGQFSLPKWPKGWEPGGVHRSAFTVEPAGGEGGARKSAPLVMHAREYRAPDDLVDRRVVVVGAGNSAMDIALEASRVASTVSLSLRHGSTVVPTTDSSGKPMDVRFLTRFFALHMPGPIRAMRFGLHVRALNNALRDIGMPSPEGGLGAPESHVGNCKAGAEYVAALQSGRIRFKPEIRDASASTVTWSDGSTEAADVVICCTGYDNGTMPVALLPGALANEAVSTSITSVGRRVQFPNLFRRAMHPSEPTLFILGTVSTLGNEACVGEMQARWAAGVLRGAIRLPSREAVASAVAKVADRAAAKGTRYPFFVPYVRYMDELARDIGCTPPGLFDTAPLAGGSHWPVPLLFRHPVLAAKLLFSPAVPAQFRLRGPNRWPGARGYIEAFVPIARL